MKLLGFGWARKSLAMVGLVAGLTVGGTTAASANTFSFTYTGSLGVFSAVFDAVLSGGYWRPVLGSVRAGSNYNGTQVTALKCYWCDAGAVGVYASGDNGALSVTDNYFPGAAPLNPAYTQLTFKLFGGQEIAYTWLGGLNGFFGTEWYGSPYPQTNIPQLGNVGYGYTSACTVDNQQCFSASAPVIHEVPEINASAGLSALGVLFGLLFVLKEMFLRRRDTTLAA